MARGWHRVCLYLRAVDIMFDIGINTIMQENGAING